MRERAELVLELIKNPQAAQRVLEELSAYGWYCEKPLATLCKSDVLAVLKQFQNHALGMAEVTHWANCIGGRTDIAYEFGPDGVVEESLYWLAHPEVAGPVDLELCKRIVKLYERRKVRRD